MEISAEELELAAAPGWRGYEEDYLGDWLLRAAGGFTGRANSALAVGDPGVPLAEAAETVRGWYAMRGLPALIAVPFPVGDPGASQVDRALAQLGWTVRAGAAIVMTADASEVAERAETGFSSRGGSSGPVQIDAAPGEGWLARYHYRGLQQLPPVALKVLSSAPWQAFASVRSGGETIAIGRVAGDAKWAGLTAIEVSPEHRRRGLGAAVTTALTAHAADLGVVNIYLQVTNDNEAARALYRRIGFTDHHGYHYRMQPAADRLISR
jgi:N-acetylglutamate synthase